MPRREISLKRLGVWLPVAVAAAIFGATLFIVAITQQLIGLAERGGLDSAARHMEELRSVGNLERLIALGDQFAVEQDPQRWRSVALTMQALAFHPSVAGLSSPETRLENIHQTVGELLDLRERETLPGGDLDAISDLAAHRARLWADLRTILKTVADDTAARVVVRTTDAAEGITRSARMILAVSIGGALVGIAFCISLLYLLRVYLLSPLLGVADYLADLRSSRPRVPLPVPNSEEMGAIVQAAGALAEAREALEVMALHDRLTGLANRYALEARLEQSMASARRHGRRLALLFLDLDRFKSINDSLGHDCGDELLKAIAQRLTVCVREADTVARLGGDEFILALNDIVEPEDAAVLARKIIEAIERPVRIDHQELGTSASIGIALFPDDGGERGTLMKNADIAMYHAKSAGRGNYQFFSPAMNEAVGERLRLELALRQALERREFLLHYQPQLDLTSGRIAGVEALIRWRRPDGELVPPATFIPLAEESGLITQIGEWVLLHACETLQDWRRKELPEVQMAVNLSARQLRQPGLPALVARLLERFELPGSLLELEITESAAMEDPAATIEILGRLRELGVRLAIDDFGTGYSSLAYLKLFPIDCLKLDRTFVKDIETDPSDAAICTATIGLAHTLNLKLLAEGVETEAQRAFLRDAGCDAFQGFLCSRPLPRDTVEPLLGRPCPDRD